jgi:hypothetical protein
MFSYNCDAWDNDPVREISDRLQNGEFRTHGNDDKFNFKNKTNKINRSRCGVDDTDMTITLDSVDSLKSFDDPVMSSYVSLDSEYPEFEYNSRCSYSVNHLKKCTRCRRDLNDLIDRKIKKNVDNLLLDLHMNKIRSGKYKMQMPSESPDSWKEILIIVSGAIIVLFLMFLIAKCVGN